MWPDSSETKELLAAARAGDAAARNELLERHRQALRRMVGLRMDRLLQRRLDASDIVQDVLVEANRRLTDYLASSGMPFGLWLRHLARDRLIDAHRRHHAARRNVEREQPLDHAPHDDRSAFDLAALVRDREMTPAAAATHHELEIRFQEAVETLDEADREVVLMRHFEQLSNRDVAQALAISESAAGMRYLRAMRRLRALLQEPPSQASQP
jgi:RNA polymerase sigma-70 factor (ECF subfamily)